MQRAIAIRLIAGLFAIAALFFGFQMLKDFFLDTDVAHVETAGMIAAIEILPQGQRAVVFKPSGEKVESSDWKPDKTDQEATWEPDGNHVFIASDREKGSFNIYRWNPVSNKVELRSSSTRSESAPFFGATSQDSAGAVGIVLSGGYVMQYWPKTQLKRQLLPPVYKDRVADEEGGAEGAIESYYHGIGTSFKQAALNGNGSGVYAVMRREDGEVLVATPITPGIDGKVAGPEAFMVGKEVQMDSNLKGDIVFVVRGFFWATPQEAESFQKAHPGKKQPFLTGCFFIPSDSSNGQGQTAVATIPDTTLTFADPAVSPDGASVALVFGKPEKEGSGLIPNGLIILPADHTKGGQPVKVAAGDISQPSWSPDGKKLAFILHENGKGSVCVVNADGSGFAHVSVAGDFVSPKFSPQTSK